MAQAACEHGKTFDRAGSESAGERFGPAWELPWKRFSSPPASFCRPQWDTGQNTSPPDEEPGNVLCTTSQPVKAKHCRA